MSRRHWMLAAYRLLLQLYPSGFRKRFAPEMLEWAEAAAVADWPLIFGDTSVAIVRCWLEDHHSTAAQSEPDAYRPIGSCPITAWRLSQGVVLATAILLGGYRVASSLADPPRCVDSTAKMSPSAPPANVSEDPRLSRITVAAR